MLPLGSDLLIYSLQSYDLSGCYEVTLIDSIIVNLSLRQSHGNGSALTIYDISSAENDLQKKVHISGNL